MSFKENLAIIGDKAWRGGVVGAAANIPLIWSLPYNDIPAAAILTPLPAIGISTGIPYGIGEVRGIKNGPLKHPDLHLFGSLLTGSFGGMIPLALLYVGLALANKASIDPATLTVISLPGFLPGISMGLGYSSGRGKNKNLSTPLPEES